MKMISGTSSGLGREMLQRWPEAKRLSHKQKEILPLHSDIIVHAASSSEKSFDAHSILPYVESHINSTEWYLMHYPRYFVYISSVDVYPKNKDTVFDELSPFSLESPLSLYGAMKLATEAMVRRCAKNHLILRLSSLLGPCQRPNAITRMIQGGHKLSLDRSSTFNCVRSADVLDFIEHCFRLGITGTFNVTSVGNIRLEEAAPNYDMEFGSFYYRTPNVSSEKAYRIFPNLKKSTKEVIEQFKQEKSFYESA